MGQFLNTATVLAVCLSWLIPLGSSLLARAHWPAELVGILTLAIAAANGFLSTWAAAPDATSYNWRHALLVSLASFAVAVLGRYGLWKDTDTDRNLLAFPKPRAVPAAPQQPPAAA